MSACWSAAEAAAGSGYVSASLLESAASLPSGPESEPEEERASG
jgi:hypothetical protein